ncbi:MAG: 30S ribosomal protein S6 [Chloroflexi bacterium]|jgi:small subunit ribosomal protein S6|nr:30S ribosomal protein S6 [Chloroflexota bacterium]
MRERRRDYEMMYIISPMRTGEEEIAEAVNRVNQSITSLGGEITAVQQTSPWGRRKFAYSIREYAEGETSRRIFNDGFYVLCSFKLASTQLSELERSLKLNDSVLRHLLIHDESHLTVRRIEERRERPERPASDGGAA